jgi:molecular chaperone IbpA
MVQFRASHMPMNFGDMEKALGFTVGFDSMFDRLFGALDHPNPNPNNKQGYPPYNIRKDGETKYFIEMAVAGLSEDDMEVELKEGILSVRSGVGMMKKEEEEVEYVHRGIAKRTFERSFTLSDDVIVKGCDLNNGMLIVELEKVIPEEKRARLIPIGKTFKSIT